MEEKKLAALTSHQLEVLERFAKFEASAEEVRHKLRDVFDFDFESPVRTVFTSFLVLEPGVLVTRACILEGFERMRSEAISKIEFMQWATMLLLNDGFEIDARDDDWIAEKLNAITFGEPVTAD